MRSRSAIVLWLALAAACTPRPSKGSNPAASSVTAPAAEAPRTQLAPGVHYTVALSGDELNVEVCFGSSVPDRLAPPMGRAIPFLAKASHDNQPLTVVDGGIGLAQVKPGGCVAYQVDVDGLIGKGSRWDGVGRLGDDLMLSPDWWLWSPDPRPTDHPIRARFEGPLSPSVPWPKADGAYPYTIPESTFIWKAQAAFGSFETFTIRTGSASLEVSILGGGFGERDAAVRTWITRSANAATALLGDFPVKRAQVLLLPEPGRTGLFGYALRGGGPSAALLVPARPSAKDLDEDWTAVHELLHFSLPPLPTTDAWLYEGLVTYFTAVARARAGILTQEEGWWELLDGFERGSKVGTGVSLRKESETMHDNRTYWRVYWSGAALALQMDVELHEQGQSLADVVSKLAKKRPDDAHDWTAAEVVKILVELCGDDAPSQIVARHLDARDFPDTTALRKALGVELDGKTVRYDDKAPKAAVRRAIMQPRSSK
jgi:hypothetical protein